MFGKKDRKISNLTIMVKNRDDLIEVQQRTINCLKAVVNSLEEDLCELRAENYKLTKKPATRKKTK